MVSKLLIFILGALAGADSMVGKGKWEEWYEQMLSLYLMHLHRKLLEYKLQTCI